MCIRDRYIATLKDEKSIIDAIIWRGGLSSSTILPEDGLEIIAKCSFEEVLNLGINIGSPVVYKPTAEEFGNERIAGTSIDDRAGCAIAIAIAEKLSLRKLGPPIHLVFSVQEEFNLRGIIPIAQQLLPDIAIQLDLILAADTADMEDRGNVSLGKGPAISLYSFHGRGTLNGIIPHPALVKLFEKTASQNNIPLQRSAHIGALTPTSSLE